MTSYALAAFRVVAQFAECKLVSQRGLVCGSPNGDMRKCTPVTGRMLGLSHRKRQSHSPSRSAEYLRSGVQQVGRANALDAYWLAGADDFEFHDTALEGV